MPTDVITTKEEDEHDTITNESPQTIITIPINEPTTSGRRLLRRLSTVLLPPEQKSSIFGTSANLANTIVGAGIISLPYAIRESGLVAGMFLILLVGFMTDKSLNILIQSAVGLKSFGIASYEDLISYPFGKRGRMFILSAMFAGAYFAMVAYLVIIKDTVPTLLGLKDEKEIVLVVTSFFIILPLSMMKNMASLAFTSFLSVICITILAVFIIAYSPFIDTVSDRGFLDILREESIHPNIFVGLGILSASMCCQHSSFLIYGSLQDNTMKRWGTVSLISISYATFLCLALGVFGYLGYLDDTEGDILNNLSDGSNAANAARGLLAVTMVFTYPLESFVARHVLVHLIYCGDMDGDEVVEDEGASSSDDDESAHDSKTWGSFIAHLMGSGSIHSGGASDYEDDSATDDDDGNETTKSWHCFNRRRRITLCLYVMALIPALTFDNLGIVLSIGGAIAGSCLSYIGPGLVFLGVNSAAFLDRLQAWLVNHNERRRENDDENDVSSSEKSAFLESLLTQSALSTIEEVSETATTASDTEGMNSALNIAMAPKPMRWYIFGFPIWYRIASYANSEMKKNALSHREEGRDEVPTSAEDEDALHEPPSAWDYFTAIFFIVFGVISFVAGISANIVNSF